MWELTLSFFLFMNFSAPFADTCCFELSNLIPKTGTRKEQTLRAALQPANWLELISLCRHGEQRESKIDSQYGSPKFFVSSPNLGLRGGNIPLDDAKEIEALDQALRSMTLGNKDRESRSSASEFHDDRGIFGIDQAHFHLATPELQPSAQDFPNGICIRTAKIGDITDMQRINLVCLPENYQVCRNAKAALAS
jgi:hypothetical protein